MSVTMSVYERSGLRYSEEPIPDGWVVVDSFTPHTCPWDYYGNKWSMEKRDALLAIGIPARICVTRCNIISPRGTGPDGRVRFGDDMCPSTYRICVPQTFEGKASL